MLFFDIQLRHVETSYAAWGILGPYMMKIMHKQMLLSDALRAVNEWYKTRETHILLLVQDKATSWRDGIWYTYFCASFGFISTNTVAKNAGNCNADQNAWSCLARAPLNQRVLQAVHLTVNLEWNSIDDPEQAWRHLMIKHVQTTFLVFLGLQERLWVSEYLYIKIIKRLLT